MLHIKEFVNTKVTEAGGNRKQGQCAVAESIKKMLAGPTPKLDARDISLRALFEAMCVPDGVSTEEFVFSPEYREAVDSSAFPISVKYITDSVAIPAYNRGLAGADMLVRDRGVNTQAGKDDSIKVRGFLSDLWPDRVYRGMPYTEGNLMEKYAEIEIATFGRIVGFTKYALLMDDGEMLNEAEMLSENGGAHRHTFIVQSAADRAVDATGRAAAKSLWYEGTKGEVYLSDHSGVEEGSQTNDNLFAGSLVTAPTQSLTDMFVGMATMKDIFGRPVRSRPNTILAPMALEIAAQVVTQSPFQSDNANNGITPRFFQSLNIVSSNVLDAIDANDWYGGDFAKAHWWYWGWKFKTDVQGAGSDADFERDEALRIKVSYRGGCGYVDYRYVCKFSN
mgnify:FL=1